MIFLYNKMFHDNLIEKREVNEITSQSLMDVLEKDILKHSGFKDASLISLCCDEKDLDNIIDELLKNHEICRDNRPGLPLIISHVDGQRYDIREMLLWNNLQIPILVSYEKDLK